MGLCTQASTSKYGNVREEQWFPVLKLYVLEFSTITNHLKLFRRVCNVMLLNENYIFTSLSMTHIVNCWQLPYLCFVSSNAFLEKNFSFFFFTYASHGVRQIFPLCALCNCLHEQVSAFLIFNKGLKCVKIYCCDGTDVSFSQVLFRIQWKLPWSNKKTVSPLLTK